MNKIAALAQRGLASATVVALIAVSGASAVAHRTFDGSAMNAASSAAIIKTAFVSSHDSNAMYQHQYP